MFPTFAEALLALIVLLLLVLLNEAVSVQRHLRAENLALHAENQKLQQRYKAEFDAYHELSAATRHLVDHTAEFLSAPVPPPKKDKS